MSNTRNEKYIQTREKIKHWIPEENLEEKHAEPCKHKIQEPIGKIDKNTMENYTTFKKNCHQVSSTRYPH